MTDKQFQSWVRFMLNALEEMDKEQDEEAKKEKLQKIIDNLQRTLED